MKGTEGGDESEENTQDEGQEKSKMKVIQEVHIQDEGRTDEGVVVTPVNRYP